ncbi:MAG TPA: superinfection immunity protein [Candidatus Omnitrophica bacterium]|nr:superinfection immunity protein [Candidatus Omnitrophota bacterium]
MKGIAFILFIILIYFLPWIVAMANNHRNSAAIALLNVLLGWTFIGWVIALVWAVMQDKEKKNV